MSFRDNSWVRSSRHRSLMDERLPNAGKYRHCGGRCRCIIDYICNHPIINTSSSSILLLIPTFKYMNDSVHTQRCVRTLRNSKRDYSPAVHSPTISYQTKHAKHATNHNTNVHLTMSSKVLLIFGAGPNTGLATVKKFANEGYKVAAVSRHPSDELKGSAHLIVPADLKEPAQIEGVFEKVTKELGPPHVVIYNGSLPFS